MSRLPWLSPSWINLSAEGAELTRRLLAGKMLPSTRWYDPDVLDLSYNENPLGPSPKAIDAISHSLGSSNLYPLVSAPRLRDRIAEHLGIAEEEVAIGCGATELVGMLGQLTLAPGDRAIYSRSSVFAYRRAVLAAGGEPVEIPLSQDFQHDLQRIAVESRAGARLVFLSNPHNPTGAVFGQAELTSFLDEVPVDVLVVLDEAYREFAEVAEVLPRSVDLALSRPNVIVLRTFSKVHGLAGIRVGYAVGGAAAIAALDSIHRHINPGGVSIPGQVAAEAALADSEHVERSVQHVCAARLRAYGALDAIGYRHLRSHANFLMVSDGVDVSPLVAFLWTHRVLVTSGQYFGCPEWFRYSFPSNDEHERFLHLLAEFRSV